MKSNELLIISVKPEYARKILRGEKTIELRKCAPKKAGKNDFILIYVTAPVKELWGIYRIENIIKETPNKLWEDFGDKTGISKKEFNEYYRKNKNAFGIQLQEVKSLLNHSIKLEILKNLIPGFMPPQTYSYVDHNLFNSDSFSALISKG